MVISTSRLCHDVAFLPPEKAKPHAIACTAVMPAEEIPSYLAAQEDRASEAEDQAEADLLMVINEIESKNPPLKKTQYVGDIEIGAHAVVPKGKEIQKSVVVGGGKEVLVATIAKSDGFVATEKELQAKGIKVTSKEVDGLTKALNRRAQGHSWRLDVIETPRGNELRGVIEMEDKKKKGSGEAAAGEAKAPKKEADKTAEKGAEKVAEKEAEGKQEGSEERYKEEL
jgi:protein OS-9